MNYFKFGLALNILKIQMNGRTTIAPSEFMNCKMLEKITIPSTVTEISEKAFANCTSLKSISIPSETTSIGDYAFAICTSLKKVNIPEL